MSTPLAFSTPNTTAVTTCLGTISYYTSWPDGMRVSLTSQSPSPRNPLVIYAHNVTAEVIGVTPSSPALSYRLGVCVISENWIVYLITQDTHSSIHFPPDILLSLVQKAWTLESWSESIAPVLLALLKLTTLLLI